jgi:pyruvate, water dikinase
MTAATGQHLIWFDRFDGVDLACVGGKSAGLGQMAGAGLPVPPGFAITSHVYRAARDSADAAEVIRSDLDGLDPEDMADVSRRALAVRELIRAWPIPAGTEADIRGAYRALSQRSGHNRVAVAVRSSATTEDSSEASFAGEYDTYLWIRGEDRLLDAVRRCWASLFTDRAISYRIRMGYSHLDVEMCVAVQKMVKPRSAGVAFTLDPGNGDRSAVAIDSAWGFGEGVVSGEVTPDNFLVDKVMSIITRRTISAKQHAYMLGDDDRVRLVELAADQATAPSLTDTEVLAVARLARAAEKHYGCPQDVEWAVDAGLPDGQNIVLLQSRPETVWSKKKVTISTGLDPMASIIATLTSPLHARKPGSPASPQSDGG